MPVRAFTWDDLPALLDFVEGVQPGGVAGREMRRRIFRETLEEPGLTPQDNCFLVKEGNQVCAFCLVTPELPIGRAVLGVDVAPRLATGPLEAQLLRQGMARARELGARVGHLCLGNPSPRRGLAEREGFTLARAYCDLVWRHDALLQPEPLPQGFTLRAFQPGDADLSGLTQVQNASFAGTWGFCPNTVAQIKYRTAMSHTAHRGIFLLFDSKAPGQPVGYCWTGLAPVAGKTRGVIGMIGVTPPYRGRGLSRPLLLAGMAYLRSVGVYDIGLHVDETNAPARRLYDAVGFQQVGELDWFEVRLG
ncbi:MAG: GNAT family N-acetyltransferase [Dehalococcoidia bacterium]|nr:GNAT family N-acetyltransferase [Dehalococcoidia bacterium]